MPLAHEPIMQRLAVNFKAFFREQVIEWLDTKVLPSEITELAQKLHCTTDGKAIYEAYKIDTIPAQTRFTWEELYGPKPETLIPIAVGCKVVYANVNFWHVAKYYGEVTRVEGRRVWVLYPDGEREEWDGNLRVVDKVTGHIHVNDTGYTDWERDYNAARKRFDATH